MATQLQTESKTPIGKVFIPVPTGILQRKCACGSHSMGGDDCAECAKKKSMLQRKLTIGASNDPLEQEADRIADQVMAAPLNSKVNAIPPRIQRFSGQVSGGMATAPPSVDRVFASSGRPFEPPLRQDMESRFGHDFSNVRVYTGDAAERSARDVNAYAYTLGNNIVFGASRFAPGTNDGRRLIAHELTHVLQQERESEMVVRRLSYGTGTPPTWTGRTLTVVPAAERAKVSEAIAIVDEIVNHPDDFRECHNHYAERCPGGGPGTLASVWGSAMLWRITAGGGRALARGETGGTNLAYTQSGYNESTRELASTLMHEAGHNCGIPGGDPHWRADQIATYCIGTGRNIVSSFILGPAGPYIGESGNVESAAWLLSYRRLLGDWVSGHLNLTLGADLNFITTVAEIVEEASKVPEEQRILGELGSVMVGLHGRVSPWGGPRFGGLTGRIETGFGAGRFALRPADPTERERTSIQASWVLQVGVGAEFAVPDIFTEGRVVPLTIQAAYRLVQPLNSEAERLHGILGGVLEIGF
jgi:hypothetical protein